MIILMSGSAVIRGGKLIGMVAHVLVNDSMRDCGVFVENVPDSER